VRKKVWNFIPTKDDVSVPSPALSLAAVAQEEMF
jgi:hypothetical protein